MKKGQSPLVTGVILCLVAVYLSVYFSLKGMWNAGTVIALVLLIGLAVFQFLIHLILLKDDSHNYVKKATQQKKKMR